MRTKSVQSVLRYLLGPAQIRHKQSSARIELLNRHLSTMSAPKTLLKYPEARRCDAVNTFPHSATVADPYRWLENPDSEETRTFVDAQNVVTQEYLGEFHDSTGLRSSIESAYAFEKFGAPKRKGDQYWYYSYNPGLLSQAQIWRSRTLEREEPELFFDPNELSEE